MTAKRGKRNIRVEEIPEPWIEQPDDVILRV